MRDKQGMSPLHVACLKVDSDTPYNIKLINKLVDFGANLDAKMRDGSTPLHLAA